MKSLLSISLRQQAVYIPSEFMELKENGLAPATSLLLANMNKLGYTFSEPLLRAINKTKSSYGDNVLLYLKEVLGVKKNWSPLVKAWYLPTHESKLDYAITYFYNVFNVKKGTTMPCGHIIPKNTFPLERYNGCPFCKTPFEFGTIEKYGQGSNLKVLDLWTEEDMKAFFQSLLRSKTALDATQMDSLQVLLQHFSLPDVEIGMKETLMTVIDILIAKDKAVKAQACFKNPNDILRYLWYKKTGFLQIVEPKVIKQRTADNEDHLMQALSRSGMAKRNKAEELKLKYSRKECRMVANWLNELPLAVEKSCEIMHTKRGMWVRFIRALRLAEYSKKQGMEKLAALLDVFYNKKYTVWQSEVNHFRLKKNAKQTFNLLQERPGLFARSLFANMLWFGAEPTITAFSEVVDKVPARLVFTLNMYAENYFDKNQKRTVKPLGGTQKKIPANLLLQNYSKKQLKKMKQQVEDLCITAVHKRFAAVENDNQSIYIDPALFQIPVSIGDRSDSIQDLPAALMGTRFSIEGNSVRLFMQWGMGLSAQYLDMDLSCCIAYSNRTVKYCSYSNLTTTGCQHSGDIIYIPDKVGAAEYIELDLKALQKAKAKYVTFTCNAYSRGKLAPEMVVGWMNSENPMEISDKTGVAYDPSCVQHQVRITQGLNKGLVFGVLDVQMQEIIWLEMSFGGQIVQNLDVDTVETLLYKLSSKLSIGTLLETKAYAQGLEIVNIPDADEVYDKKWARDTAAVTQLLID